MKNLDDMLKEIEARANAATEGPWEYEHKYFSTQKSYAHRIKKDHFPIGFEMTSTSNKVLPTDVANFEFIANARTDVPKLLAMLRLAIEQRDTAYTCSWDKDLGSMIADDDLALLAVGRGE